jgi:branched-chain amino acid transport system substrate-binding protein
MTGAMARRTLAVAAAALATSTLALGASAGAPAPIRIAMVAPLSGPYSFVGVPGVRAARRAVQAIDASGGVLGHRLVLDVFDDRTDPAVSLAETRKIVADPRYVATIGTGFATAALGDEKVARGKLLYLGMSASAKQVTPPQRGVFVVPPTSRSFAQRLSGYLAQHHLTRIALLHDDGAYPTEGIAAVRTFAKRDGLRIVSDQVFSLQAADWRAELNAIASSNAQAVWLWNVPQAVAITRQFRKLGLTQQLVLSGGNATSNYTKPVCPAANGALADSALAEIAAHLPKTNKARALALRADRVTGDPGNQFAYDAYTGVQLVAQAIEKAKGDTARQTLIRQFDHFTHWEPEGLYVYSATRHVGLGVGSVVAERVQGCKLVPLPGQLGK